MPKIALDHSTGSEIPNHHPVSDDDDDDIHYHEESDDDDEDDDENEDDEDYSESDGLESWVDVPVPGDRKRDDIDPSESASRSRQPASSSRNYSSFPRPQARRSQSSRKYPEVIDPPTRPPPRRRTTKDVPRRPRSAVQESPMEDDDWPYPPRSGYHPAPGWGNVGLYPPQGHGHARTIMSGGPDPFAGGQYDPYSPQASQNPFTLPPDDFYSGRGGRGAHRNSMQGPPRAHGQELMAMTAQGFGAYPPYGFPGYPPYGYPPGYPHPPLSVPPHHSPSPAQSKKGTPAPIEEPKPPPPDPGIKAIEALLLEQKKREEDKAANAAKAASDASAAAAAAKLKAEEDKLMKLQDLIIQHNKDQMDREKRNEAARAAETAAKLAAEKSAEEEKKRADEKAKEVKAAAEKATMEAKLEAAKVAQEEKEKHDKEIAEAKKKADALEAAKKKAEDEAKALRPTDDMLKPPIRFKDAVGRKFSFPWHLCKTWKGMEALIHQAFLHVDVIGSHVHEGHYDLIGPDGEIILPQVWETMVKPDWSITMHMWPIASPKDKVPPPPPGGMPHGVEALLGGPAGKKKSSKKDRKGFSGLFGSHPPAGGPPGAVLGPPPVGGPPPPPPGGHIVMDSDLINPGIAAVLPESKGKSKKSKKVARTGMALWLAGGPSTAKHSSIKRKK